MINPTAAVFAFANLPGAAQAKQKKHLAGSDLSPAQQTEATGRHVCAVVDGNQVTLIDSGTCPIGLAMKSVKAERNVKGI